MSTLREYCLPDWPAAKNVSAACTTRVGGVSLSPYDGFNLGMHVGDDQTAVQQNRELLQKDLKLARAPYWLNQTHTNIVASIDDDKTYDEADGAYTAHTNRPCLVMTADCLPILLCDKAGTKVAALHGGWRGLAGGIIENGVRLFDTDESQIMAWLGPAIGPNAFEVGPEVRDTFINMDTALDEAFIAKANGKYLANIFTIAKILLAKQNVTAVYGGDICTVSDPRFYSYRRDQGQTGRMATLIWLNGQNTV